MKKFKNFIGRNERRLSDAQVAKLIANRLYGVNVSDGDFAIQLFMEAVVLPDSINRYDQDEFEFYIRKFMKENRKTG